MDYKTFQSTIFGIFALLFIIASGHHLYEYFYPYLRPNYPEIRHLALVFINLFMSAMMVKRHKCFLPFLLLVVVQQIYGHGLSLYQNFSHSTSILYTDIVIIVLMPILLVTYTYDVLRPIKKP